MKILILAPYISVDGTEFTRHRTGFGYMVKDIGDSIAKFGMDVSVLTQSAFTKNNQIGKLNILGKTYWNVISSLCPFYCYCGIRAFLNKNNLRKKLNAMFYFISGGYIEKVIKEQKADVVHIHGIGYYSLTFIMACIRCKVPFVVTLHGLVSLGDAITVAAKEREIEQQFIRLSTEKNIPVTVISSGIRRRIKKEFNIKKDNNILVVQNGTDVSLEDAQLQYDIKTKYNILANTKIMLCVGNISENKNQIQVIHALYSLDNNLRRRLMVLFLGNDTLNGRVQNEANKLGVQDNVIFCGIIPKDEIKNYYIAADFNVTASINEGFGLSITEAFIYGIPTACFSDIDAVPDLFNENCMVLAEERSDQALADAITNMCNKIWDRLFIRDYSKRFSLEIMAGKYIEIYKKTRQSNVNIKDIIGLLETKY